MGVQIVIATVDAERVAEVFASHGVTYEMFPMHGRATGISIPADVIDELGESTIDKVLGSFTYIDLWSGRVRGEQKA
ncbi:hypothetical protein [Luteibacter sp. E-22]|uniref:hypothetical protein n=1 Tax=Luteibacter sp. E-22 TaxID=3404050 RepID=UPI003CED7167